VSPHVVGFQRVINSLHVLPGKKKKGGDLFVSDFALNAVEELANKTWGNVGSITTGIEGPDGNWVDTKGNLYVANYEGLDITEYAKGSSSPKYTYSGVEDPVGVATDAKGNVFEADFEGSYVTEFSQGGSQTAQCSSGSPAEGVAVDKAGDVFASTETSLVEFKGGLSGCSMTTLYSSLEFGGGMAMDKKGNILVCDQDAEAVDVFKAPYTSISGTFGSGYSDPFHITINKKQKQAYVANYTGDDVFVLSYPAGSLQATLNSSNGLSNPVSAVDSSNLVP
jgi:DNA-binding beta-propeller fold protein YncE